MENNPPFPIDFVWTLCTPQNDAPQRRYKAQPGELVLKCHAVPDLLYSLRSAHTNAPWYRRIILIISDHDKLPAYIKPSAKLVVVRHAEFIPKTFLPTFNSNVIESYIHLIPGLSDQFVYWNDDTYICKPTTWKTFFTKDGLPINRHCIGLLNHSLKPTENMFIKMMQNAISSYGMQWTRYQHQVQPFSKALISHYAKIYTKQIRTASKHRYRHPKDFNLLRFTTCFSSAENLTKHIQTPESVDLFLESSDVEEKRKTIRRPRFLCINNTYPNLSKVQALQAKLFPQPSPYEI
jgi:hypothetical protein